jgi:hypothetical protein
MLMEIIEALAPHLIEALMALITLATGYGVVQFKRWTGIQIEERHRQALHSAIRTGVVALAERGLTGDELIKGVKDYIRQSVPDALASLVPGDGVLSTLIKAKVRELAG